MKTYQTIFIDLALKHNVLSFGEFTLKSGRVSPYFFNAGEFKTGNALRILGECYAHAIYDNELEFDVLFGPAYKGINLAATTAIALDNLYHQDKPFAYNRKEKKDHGEGGLLVGADLQGKNVLLIDDVISAGTAAREMMPVIKNAGGNVSGFIVSLDRQERGQGAKSAVQEISDEFNIPVIAIASLATIIDYLKANDHETLNAVLAYKEQYGA